MSSQQLYNEVQKLVISSHQQPMRLDSYLGQHLPNLSRSQGHKLIAEGRVAVNGVPRKASYQIQPDDVLEIALPRIIPPEILPEKIELNIVFEDDDLLLIDKPAELVVHPAKGHHNGTIVNALMYHMGQEEALPPGSRPGIVHRLDKDTTGLLLLAKTDLAQRELARQFQERLIHRTYHALTFGPVEKEQGTIDAPLGRSTRDRKLVAVVPDGKQAVTHFRVLENYNFATLMELKLDTGRTHQIRVHLQHENMPVLADPSYGGGEKRAGGFVHRIQRFIVPLLRDMPRQCLHAKRLEFFHPVNGLLMEFEIDYPADMAELIRQIRDFHNQQ
jgi:23S rRNA pseudouridine1911/1915/1917 synthase